MLYNTANRTWHPIFYFESPFPGEMSTDRPVRYKSKGHHTTGFPTREAAILECKDVENKLLSECGTRNVINELETDIEWNGDGVPADIQLRPSHYIKMAH